MLIPKDYFDISIGISVKRKQPRSRGVIEPGLVNTRLLVRSPVNAIGNVRKSFQ